MINSKSKKLRDKIPVKERIAVEDKEPGTWSGVDKTTPASNVLIPTESQVIAAKKWVDENEK
jgi:Domain of unknown function (DUF3787)